MTQTEDGYLKDATNSLSNFADSRNSVLFTRLPIPPSSNNQYFLASRGSKTYHIPSDELKRFKRAMEEYPLRCSTEYLVNRHKVQAWVKDHCPLEIRVVFFFERSRVLTKDNRPKKFDVSNRIKALHDSLSKMIGIDDCWFFRVYAEKACCDTNLQEMSCVEIIPIL